jgi:hypothetical protein
MIKYNFNECNNINLMIKSWNGCYQLHDEWINYPTNVFQKMECCIIYGIVKLNHQ